jgi:hypothetical protein
VLLLRNAAGQKSVILWGISFILIAAAAVAGGTFHGFRGQLGWLANPLWQMVVYSVGLCALLMACSTIFATIKPSWQQILLVILVVKFGIFVLRASTHTQYKYVAYEGLTSMGIILVLQIAALITRHQMSAKWILAGTAISVAAAGIQISGFNLHRHLNHNDLYHIVQMIGMYVWYRGGLLLKDLI